MATKTTPGILELYITRVSHLIDCINFVYCLHQNINLFVIVGISDLNGFTLSHYGSSFLLSTLTLDITVSEPRLDTGCWLDITRQDPYLLYDISLNPPVKKERNLHVRYYFLEKSIFCLLVMKICSCHKWNEQIFYLTYSVALQPLVNTSNVRITVIKATPI